MEDHSILNYLSTSNNNSTSPNESYKKINTYNITGINDIHTKKEISTKDDTSKFNYITEAPNSRREISEQNEKNEKIKLIRSFIKKPDNQMPYDGYACFRKKPTINYLLRKFDKKDNKIIFEKHKLCKKPYPLIKFLSNRKSPNHSKHLITDMLSAEFKELSIQQKNDINYKNYIKPINLYKIKYPEINNKINIIRKINFSEKKNKNENNKIDFPLLNRFTEEKFLSRDNSTKNCPNNNIYNCLTIRPVYNDRKIKKSLMNSYCGVDNNLIEHNAVLNNISILKNKVTKKLHSNYDDILKDISILKSNNHIMAYES